MSAAPETSRNDGPLGNATSPAPSLKYWLIGGGIALLVHIISAIPFLPAPAPEEELIALDEPGEEIGVSLAPVIQPPKQEAPPPTPEPEIEPERPVIQERSDDSPPPAPPKEPRKIPDLPDITPQAVPELWTGEGGSGDSQMTLEEYLFLQEWLKAARKAVLERLRYPEAALNHLITGNAKVVIVADRSGKIVSWRFISRTGSQLLDREVERTIKSIRRLPPFPEGTRYDTLSYLVTIRFELVRPDGSIMADTEIEEERERQPDAPVDTLSRDHIAKCAASAAFLTGERNAVMAERERLEQLRADYLEEVERYQRQRRDTPRRVTRMREEYERDAQAFDDRITSFNDQAGAYRALCGGGSTTYEEFAPACRRYIATGNEYCEAFGQYWARLKAEG